MRLDKLLTALNIGSRTQVQGLIRRGAVAVNGAVQTDPAAQVSGDVSVCGKDIDTRLERFLMMNKPAGVLTAAEDHKQKTVLDLLPGVYKTLGCMPVGRLDKDTTGLLLFTTDGTLAHRLIAPKYEIWKTYIARVDSDLSPADCEAFEKGIHFKDFDTLPARLEILDGRTAKVMVSEGKFHQVKRMLHALGHEVLDLKRVAFGPIGLDENLAPGEFRELSDKEKAELLSAAKME